MVLAFNNPVIYLQILPKIVTRGAEDQEDYDEA